MNGGQITRNFNLKEFTCKCGCGYSRIDFDLVRDLQKLRDSLPPHKGKERRIHVTSGCRCTKHNKAVGGASDSKHLTGKAADIWADEMTAEELYRYAVKVPGLNAGGIGLYPTYRQGKGVLHVDHRNHKARWGKLTSGSFITIDEAVEASNKGK